MKAFLSHSSKNKGFVEKVAEMLRPGTYELDSETFDAGLLNSEMIIKALKRSELFCLFLSSESIESSYVFFETILGLEFFAKGKIKQFLVICLDSDAFDQASENIKLFSIVRKVNSVEQAAWLVQGSLVSASSGEIQLAHPFIGREEVLNELEKQVLDPDRPTQKALYVSGNFGSGRRSVVRKFFQNQYPRVGNAFPQVIIDQFDGYEEIYRKLLAAIRPSMPASEIRTRFTTFGSTEVKKQARLIAELFNSILPQNESILLIDNGGVLNDEGSFYSDIKSVLNGLDSRPYPPISIISPRMMPPSSRRDANDIAFVGLKSLERHEAERLALSLLKQKDISVTKSQLAEIVELSDRHPYNFYAIVEEVASDGISIFLSNPSDFVEWKHRRSSEYLSQQELDSNDIEILSLLRILPVLDFEGIVSTLDLSSSKTADALQHLIQLHLVEHSGDEFSVSPALRIAVGRDQRFIFSETKKSNVLAKLAASLALRLDDGTAPISLLDSAVLSAIESKKETYALIYLLPSHYVWLAKRKYDEKNYSDCIFFAEQALGSANRLSKSASVAACRFMCLASAREGNSEVFNRGISYLEKVKSDKWSRSNVFFLKGFNERMKGHLPIAEEHFREAYALSPGNYSVARELAAVCLARGNLEDAERFAREIYAVTSTNVYVLDIFIAVLARKLGSKVGENYEIRDLMDQLEEVGDEGGRSFYTTRSAEIFYLEKKYPLARKFVEKAIARTPNIFENGGAKLDHGSAVVLAVRAA